MDQKMCVLYNRPCDDCGECNRCDLDPNKICDNCFHCLDLETNDQDYLEIPLSKLYNKTEDNIEIEDDELPPIITISGFRGVRKKHTF